MEKTAEKPIVVVARINLKKTGQVFYRVRSSGGVPDYDVEVEYGFGVNCTCPRFTHKKMCKHLKAVTQREAQRNKPGGQKKAEAGAAKHTASTSGVAEKMHHAPLNSSRAFRILR